MAEKEYYTGNYFLTYEQMKTNAYFLYGELERLGWTLNAISGLLGNAQTESSINPGIWQNLAVGKGPGYGLLQWTPYTKYTDWCTAEGLEKSDMESAVKRIQYEIEHGLQWGETKKYPMSFEEYIYSEKSPYYLAMVFLYNYEKPANLNQPKRGTQAEKWYSYLSGGNIPPPPEPGEGGNDRNEYKASAPLNPALYKKISMNRRKQRGYSKQSRI